MSNPKPPPRPCDCRSCGSGTDLRHRRRRPNPGEDNTPVGLGFARNIDRYQPAKPSVPLFRSRSGAGNLLTVANNVEGNKNNNDNINPRPYSYFDPAGRLITPSHDFKSEKVPEMARIKREPKSEDEEEAPRPIKRIKVEEGIDGGTGADADVDAEVLVEPKSIHPTVFAVQEYIDGLVKEKKALVQEKEALASERDEYKLKSDNFLEFAIYFMLLGRHATRDNNNNTLRGITDKIAKVDAESFHDLLYTQSENGSYLDQATLRFVKELADKGFPSESQRQSFEGAFNEFLEKADDIDGMV